MDRSHVAIALKARAHKPKKAMKEITEDTEVEEYPEAIGLASIDSMMKNSEFCHGCEYTSNQLSLEYFQIAGYMV